MPTYTKTLLFNSTNGKAISVAQTVTPGTLIHQTGTSPTVIDEVWLYAFNTSGSSVKLTIEWGGTTSSDTIEVTISPEAGLSLVISGLCLAATSGSIASSIRAFAAIANVVNIVGFVNRITP